MPRGVLAAVATLVVVLVAALVVWRVGDDDYVVRPDAGGPGAARAQPVGAARVLAELVAAVEADDVDGAADLATAEAGSLLEAVVTNAGLLDVDDLDLRYVDEVGAVARDGTWQAAVAVTWRFAGVDPGPANEEVLFSFAAPDDGEVVVSGIGGGERRLPLWLAGPLDVRRGADALVLSAAGPEAADAVLADAVAAVPVVRRVLPRWRGPLVVEVPASEQGLDAALAAAPGTYTNVAAVTATVDGSTEVDSPVHVFLNPSVYDALDAVGAQVVVSHEATHVATDAPLHVLPPWLLEGFADYVALRDVDLPLTTTAGQVAAQVRSDGVPDALPDQADFDETSEAFGAAYEAAWLACRTLADRAGEDALVQVYEAVSDGAPVEEALEAQAGLSVAELTRAWQDRLAQLVR